MVIIDFHRFLQVCKYGGPRDKWTKLICSKGLYDDINQQCDKYAKPSNSCQSHWKTEVMMCGGAKLEQVHAIKAGTVVKATKKFSEVEQWFGVWRTPEQSVAAAELIEHPLNMQILIPDLLLRAIATVLESGPQNVAAGRAAHCKRPLQQRAELKVEETNLHVSLDPQVRAVLKGKQILLWRELLVETEFTDLDIVDEVLGGIRLVGTANTSNEFPAVTAAQQSVKQLQSQSIPGAEGHR